MVTFHRKAPLWITTSLTFALTACGGDDAGTPGAAGGADDAAVEIENPGVVTGTVAFTGTAPALQPIDMRDEPVCAEKHSEPPVQEAVVVNDNGTLSNVFVWVREGVTQSGAAQAGTPELDQDGCEYLPRVLGVQAGRPFVIRNSDAVLHNINARASTNRGFNISQPQEGMTSERSFATQEVMVPVQCDVHSWMTAYVGVVDHPYYAVSGDDGSFTIENLPPGDYVVEAWHEEYGTQTVDVTVPPNGTVEAPFSYSGETTTASAAPPSGSSHHDLAFAERQRAD
ncbi:MAG: carboxypeptidase regulatory-like domain-containing protein [Gemmatimonadota bacterium]